MTRKQALELAVQTLAGNKEAVQVLHTMIDELPPQPLDGGGDPGFCGAVYPGQRPPAPCGQTSRKSASRPTPLSSAASASPCRSGWIRTTRPKRHRWMSSTPRPQRPLSESIIASSRSAPRTTTPDAPIRPAAGTPSPSATTPAAGASCWRS